MLSFSGTKDSNLIAAINSNQSSHKIGSAEAGLAMSGSETVRELAQVCWSAARAPLIGWANRSCGAYRRRGGWQKRGAGAGAPGWLGCRPERVAEQALDSRDLSPSRLVTHRWCNRPAPGVVAGVAASQRRAVGRGCWSSGSPPLCCVERASAAAARRPPTHHTHSPVCKCLLASQQLACQCQAGGGGAAGLGTRAPCWSACGASRWSGDHGSAGG